MESGELRVVLGLPSYKSELQKNQRAILRLRQEIKMT